jgi:hypothetical protein
MYKNQNFGLQLQHSELQLLAIAATAGTISKLW